MGELFHCSVKTSKVVVVVKYIRVDELERGEKRVRISTFNIAAHGRSGENPNLARDRQAGLHHRRQPHAGVRGKDSERQDAFVRPCKDQRSQEAWTRRRERESQLVRHSA